jgi:hypothetical protein
VLTEEKLREVLAMLYHLPFASETMVSRTSAQTAKNFVLDII